MDTTTTAEAIESDDARSEWATFALVAGAIVVGSLNYSIVFVAFPELPIFVTLRHDGVEHRSLSLSVKQRSETASALTRGLVWSRATDGTDSYGMIGTAAVLLTAVGFAIVNVTTHVSEDLGNF